MYDHLDTVGHSQALGALVLNQEYRSVFARDGVYVFKRVAGGAAGRHGRGPPAVTSPVPGRARARRHRRSLRRSGRARRMAGGGVRRIGRGAGRRAQRSLVVLALAPLLAVVLALAALHAVGLTGVDSAAHVYKTSLVAHGQALAWDNLWYGGSYGVLAYGAGYYLLAALVGSAPVIVVSAGLLPLLFHLYVARAWGVTSRLPALALAGVVVVYLANGQDPFLLAMALTMAGLALLAADHPVWAACRSAWPR